MKFGAFLTTAHYPGHTQEQVFDTATTCALEAERLGFDGAWVLEHHFTRFGLCAHPITMAAYLLGKTTTLRVGSAVCVLPLYHPVQLAEQVAMIDQLSDGRFDFGIGRGLFQKDFQVFGVDPARTHELMREWIAIIERAWGSEVVEAKSDLIEFPPVPLYPQPRSEGGPPVYVVCESPSSTEWVASQGYPMMMSWWLEREAIRAQVELYDEVARAHGHDPEGVDHILSCIAHVADSAQEAREAVRDNIAWWRKVSQEAMLKFEELRKLPNYEFVFRRWEDQLLSGAGDPDAGEAESVERLLELNVLGTPDECVESLCELAELTGVRHVICGFEGVGDLEGTLGSMRRFAGEVAPRVRERVGAEVGA